MKINKLHILLPLLVVITSSGIFASGFKGSDSFLDHSSMLSADYDSVYLMGSATPAGWDIANPVLMEMDTNDSLVFHWTGRLSGSEESPGEIKFPTYKGADAWCEGDWIHPVEAGQSTDNPEAVILTGCAENNPDYKWNVTQDTTYKVTVNLNDTTVTFTQVAGSEEDSQYDNLYLVGDATPGGWDLANQTAMTPDTSAYAFSWTGTLSAGEFKLKTYQASDFCAGEWIHPLEQGQDLTETGFEILQGCVEGNTDYKWVIAEADTGTYEISVDFSDSTITIQKQTSTSIDERAETVKEFSLSQNYPNPFNPSTNIEFSLNRSSEVKLAIYDVLGNEVQTLVNRRMSAGNHMATFNSSGLASGVYIYRLITPEITFTKKMTLVK